MHGTSTECHSVKTAANLALLPSFRLYMAPWLQLTVGDLYPFVTHKLGRSDGDFPQQFQEVFHLLEQGGQLALASTSMRHARERRSVFRWPLNNNHSSNTCIPLCKACFYGTHYARGHADTWRRSLFLRVGAHDARITRKNAGRRRGNRIH